LNNFQKLHVGEAPLAGGTEEESMSQSPIVQSIRLELPQSEELHDPDIAEIIGNDGEPFFI